MSSKYLASLVVIGLVCCNGDEQVCVTDTSPDGSCSSTGSSGSSEGNGGTTSESSTSITMGTTVDTTMGSSESTTDDTSSGTTSDASSTTIGSAVCGDGMVDEGEECDLGMGNANDGPCTSYCQNAKCGDGFLYPRFEVCDEGGNSPTCDSDCTIPECGDGLTNSYVGEKCDDANMDNTDGCLVGCVKASCGDGIVWRGEENCDDGNDEELDGCTTQCEPTPSATTLMVAAGAGHTCAVLQGGDVRCWGYGKYGQLGYGNPETIGDDEFPKSMNSVDVGGPAIRVTTALGSFLNIHSCAILMGGDVRCWGYGKYGQLGYGNTETIGDDELPSSMNVVDVGGPVIQLQAGSSHTCALLMGGGVRCWGYGEWGRLGSGNEEHIGDDESPSSASLVQVGGPVIHLSVGNAHSCVVLQNGDVRCWGWGSFGRLGYGHTKNIGDDELPIFEAPVGLAGPAIQVEAGTHHTCALLMGGNVSCWGANLSGQLGYGHTNTIGDDEPPSAAGLVSIGGPVVQLDVGGHHTCVLLTDGNVRCWGYNPGAFLGYGNVGNIGDDELPSDMPPLNVGGPAIQVATGGEFTCVLLATGDIRCWGYNHLGQLGYGHTYTLGDTVDEMPTPPVQVN